MLRRLSTKAQWFAWIKQSELRISDRIGSKCMVIATDTSLDDMSCILATILLILRVVIIRRCSILRSITRRRLTNLGKRKFSEDLCVSGLRLPIRLSSLKYSWSMCVSSNACTASEDPEQRLVLCQKVLSQEV